MKWAIEVADIRKGDLIRWESEIADYAYEWRASVDGVWGGRKDGQHYLLDRPDPFPEGSTWYIAEDCKSWYSSAKRGEEVTIKFHVPNVLENERTVAVTGDSGRQCIVVKTKYLVKDRPTPPVELPTEATFGVLEWTSGPNTQAPGARMRVAAEWYQSPCVSGFGAGPRSTQVHAVGIGLQVPMRAVTAFTRAKAVPAGALEDLRVAARNANYTGSSRVALAYAREGLKDFLAAIDAAGSGA